VRFSGTRIFCLLDPIQVKYFSAMNLFAALIALCVCQIINTKPILEQFGADKVEKMHIASDAAKKGRRCGVKDGPATRSLGNEVIWDNEEITWAIGDFSKHMFPVVATQILAEAFKYWEAIIPRKFVMLPTESYDKANIKIRFATGHHGDTTIDDESDFDGPGNELAHAWYPKHGGVHFDDDETWYSSAKYEAGRSDFINLLLVAIHEIGHALGLPHARGTESIMYPHYIDLAPGTVFKFSANDVSRIQALYGKKNH